MITVGSLKKMDLLQNKIIAKSKGNIDLKAKEKKNINSANNTLKVDK